MVKGAVSVAQFESITLFEPTRQIDLDAGNKVNAAEFLLARGFVGAMDLLNPHYE